VCLQAVRLAVDLIQPLGIDRAVTTPCNDHRFSAKTRVVTLFDGCIERVHVDVNDFARCHAKTILGLMCQSRYNCDAKCCDFYWIPKTEDPKDL